MLNETLNEIVDNLNASEPNQPSEIWNFKCGPDAWQNLGDFPEDQSLPFEERKKYLMLLWQDRETKLGNYGSVQGYTFTGDMILSVRSKLSDPTYKYKYETHIKKLYSVSERIMNSFSDCDGFTVLRWKETEVTDVYDTNVDGLKISMTIEWSNE